MNRRMNRGEKLHRLRNQVLLVRTLSEQLKALSPDGVRAVALTGMPKGSWSPGGLDAQIARREGLERMLARECVLRARYEREVRAEMDTMKPEHYAFCAMYYLAGMTVEESAGAIDRSVRQCMRYKREIEDGQGDIA